MDAFRKTMNGFTEKIAINIDVQGYKCSRKVWSDECLVKLFRSNEKTNVNYPFFIFVFPCTGKIFKISTFQTGI